MEATEAEVVVVEEEADNMLLHIPRFESREDEDIKKTVLMLMFLFGKMMGRVSRERRSVRFHSILIREIIS